jgi:mRNA interferase HigB
MEKSRKNHIISEKKFRQFCESHPDHRDSWPIFHAWYKVASRSCWTKFADIRATFGSADRVGKFVVFNVGGNKYRVIVDAYYDGLVFLIRHVLTHPEYDDGKWKRHPAQ